MPSGDTYYGTQRTPEIRAFIEAQRAQKKLERANAGKVMRRLAKKLKTLGFIRKSTWFARESGPLVQFMHVHKFTFGPCFRLHWGIRVLNDSQHFVALSGPDESRGLEYGPNEASVEQCVEAMYLLVAEVVEPWFTEQTTERLLEMDSYLSPSERDALRWALAGQVDHKAVKRSCELLGLY
jgi:hypothetical protein